MDFILSLTRPGYYCTLEEARFPIKGNAHKLGAILDVPVQELDDHYKVSAEDIARLAETFDLHFTTQPQEGSIGPMAAVHHLSYSTHTNRELDLMRAGTKPLSVFCSAVGETCAQFDLFRANFLPFVQEGIFVRREVIVKTGRKHDTLYECYALPHEAWRIDAYLLVEHTARITGWSEAMYRMEGSLYGYTDAQNDEYIAHRARVLKSGKDEVRSLLSAESL